MIIHIIGQEKKNESTSYLLSGGAWHCILLSVSEHSLQSVSSVTSLLHLVKCCPVRKQHQPCPSPALTCMDQPGESSRILFSSLPPLIWSHLLYLCTFYGAHPSKAPAWSSVFEGWCPDDGHTLCFYSWSPVQWRTCRSCSFAMQIMGYMKMMHDPI